MQAFLRRFTIQQRLIAVTGATIVLILGLMVTLAMDFNRSLFEGRALATRYLVETGMSVLQHHHDRAQRGEISQQQAQEAAAAALRQVRYGDNEYYWIHNLDFVMVMHPINERLIGQNVRNLQDPKGTYLFQDMNRVVREQRGAGFVPYEWPKPGFDQPVRKISYVQLFEPWGWVLGTGVYLDDVEAQFWRDMGPKFAIGTVIIIALVGFIVLISLSITRPLGQAVTAMRDIASGEGDLTRRLDQSGNDELAQLGQGFNAFTRKLADVVNQLKTVVDRNNDIATGVDASVSQADTSFNQQKHELDTVASAVEQMSATVEEVARRISEAAEAAKAANTEAEQGEQLSQRTSQRMSELASGIQSASAAITQLNEQTQAIGGVLDVIRGVAEQTNLLALNAAIEAARAGEQGRGFAVVADEVRTLASRTQQSTDEIQEMITTLQAGAGKAVDSMAASHRQSEKMQEQVSSTASSLHAIAAAVSTITDMTQHVAAAAEEQSQTSSEISRSLNQLSSLGDQVQQELSETGSNTLALRDVSQTLDGLVRQFNVD